MTSRIYEIITGFCILAIALISFICFDKATNNSSKNSYALIAYFRAAEGIRKDSNVCIAGVAIGKVKSITLNKSNLTAKIEISLPQDLKIANDSKICIRSESLLGGKFLEIKSGNSPISFKAGEEIFDTQSSISIEDLFAKMMFSKS